VRNPEDEHTLDFPKKTRESKLRAHCSGGRTVKLAIRVDVGEKAVAVLESGGQWRRQINLGFVRERVESAGVISTEENGDGSGVCLRKSKPKSHSADE
jgi:hypothetical protein